MLFRSDNELSIVKWDSQQDPEAYVKFRHGDGSFDFLSELVAYPLDISALSPISFKSDEEQIDMNDVDYKIGIRSPESCC